jgi:hypothetical protein
LDETYARILSKITDNRDDVVRILQWLYFSAAPMTVDEMIEALAVDLTKDPPRFETELRLLNPRDFLEICPNLIVITTEIRHPFRPDDKPHPVGETEEVQYCDFLIHRSRNTSFQKESAL